MAFGHEPNISGISNKSETRRSPRDQPDIRWTHGPDHVTYAGRMCGERPGDHIGGQGGWSWFRSYATRVGAGRSLTSTMPSVGSGTYSPGPNMGCSPQKKVRTGSVEAITCPVYSNLRIPATVSTFH